MKRCKMFDVRWMMFLLLVEVFNVQRVFAQNDAMYIYRNDGEFNAFFKSDIDSIAQSHYDADSIYHADWQMQVVYTQDSIYKIPIAAIDSVSFVQPETILQPKVVQMEKKGLLDYLQAVDGMSLLFRTTIPRELQPQAGEVLLYTDFDNPLLSDGFAGKVLSAKLTDEAFRVDCDSIYDIFEVFEQLISIERIVDESASSRRRVSDEWISGRNSLNFNLGYSHSISDSEKVSLSGSVDGTYIATVIYNITRKEQYIRLKIDHDWQYGAHLNFKKELGSFGTLKGPVASLPAIRFAHVFKFQISGCPFVKGEGNMELDLSFSSPVHSYVGEAVYRNGRFSGWNHKKPAQGSNTPNVEAAFSLNGSVQAGYMVDLWLGLDISIKGIAKDFLKVGTGLDFYIGPKLSGDFSMKRGSENPVNYYSIYKDSKIGIDWLHVDYEFFGEASLAGHKFPKAMFCDGSLQSPLNHEWYILPEFSDLSVDKDREKKQATISTTPSRDILVPLSVGMGLYDSDGKLLSTKYESKKYKRENEGFEIEQTFSSLDTGKEYTAKPFIKFLGGEIPALPEETFDILVTLSDFKVTKKQYKKGAFIHEGKPYDYRFDVTVTATFEGNTEDIADWGYVYLDPNGKEAFISLYEFGHSKEDDRWAYFRSGTPPFTCTLYGYVKYVGNDEPVCGKLHGYSLLYDITVDTGSAAASYTEARCWGNASDSNNTIYDECGFFYNMTGSPQKGNASRQFCSMNADGSFNAILSGLTEDTQYFYTAYVRMGEDYYYGEPKTFKTNKKEAPEDGICPDGHHPHNIDLGLPSGTKWKCCNYGSNSPIDVGFYLAWGETSEKNTYTKENYNWHHVKGDGTYVYENATFDLAPSKSDVSELQRVCSQEETVLGGVIGMMYIGPNGNRIFLPYGGVKGETLYFYGEEDHYWTNKLDSRSNNINIQPSTRSDNDKDEGISNAFDWYDLDWRYLGKNVRQVIH